MKIPNIILSFSLILLFTLALILFSKIVLFNNLKKPNLILISIDTLRSDHMGIYGYKRNTTPTIDAWAQKASIFTNTYTIVPLTYPSFTALMTGKYPIDTRIIDNYGGQFSNRFETLAEKLKKRGYQTGASVTNTALSPKLTSINRGFDLYQINEDEKEIGTSFDFIDSGFEWIEVNKQKPFFFWFHIKVPHRPYYPPQQFRNIFSTSYTSTIDGLSFNDARMKQEELVKELKCSQDSKIEQDQKTLIDTYTNLYDEDVLYSDYIFKYIIEYIQDAGLNKNSIIVLYGDHGESIDHGYYFNHGRALYNSSIKIPFIIRLPDNIKRSFDSLIDNTSIHVIIDNILRSDLSLLTTKKVNDIVKKSEKDQIYFVDNALTRGAVIKGNYKYIKTLKNDDCLAPVKNVEELYDLRLDSNENKNLAASRKHKQELYNLRNSLKQIFTKYFPSIKKINNNSEENLNILKSLGY